MADVPVVPAQSPGQSGILLPHATAWPVASWYTAQTITGIPTDALGWLTAQGWSIAGVQYDNTTVPPTPTYAMSRSGLLNWVILQSLLNSYTLAYNEARDCNTLRYNEVVANWTTMIDSSQTQFQAQTAEQNAHAAIYIGNLNTHMDRVEELVNANSTTLDTAVATATALLDTTPGILDAHANDYDALLSLLQSDYDLHAVTAENLLDGLGTTELARINEKWDAELSDQMQALVDRGLYSSALVVDLRTRIARERIEDIGKLNDSLARERLDNEHKLYGQKFSMRTARLEGSGKLYGLRTELLRYRLAQTLQNADALASQRGKVVAELMSIDAARLQGLQSTHEAGMKLLAYQLEERNKLLIGLYGFVERREDKGPQFEDLAKLCAGLADAGGGWVSP